jgi:hypothetical protein
MTSSARSALQGVDDGLAAQLLQQRRVVGEEADLLLGHRLEPTEPALTPALEADAIVSERLIESGLGDPVVQAYCRASITGVANQQIANQLDQQFNVEMVHAAVDAVIAMSDRRRRTQTA